MSTVVFCFILFWTNKCVWSTPLTVIFFVIRVMLTAAFSHCGLSLVVRAAVIQKRETENMGMGSSLSTSAGKGEQMLLLYAPLGKLLKTHCHATYLSRQLFFQIICGSRGTPVKTVFSILWGEASGGPCWRAHLLAQFLSPQAPIKLGAALLLLPTALAKPWRWATKNPTTAFGGLAGGLSGKGPGPRCAGGKLRGGKQWEKDQGECGESSGSLGRRHPEGMGCTSWLSCLFYAPSFPFLNNTG